MLTEPPSSVSALIKWDQQKPRACQLNESMLAGHAAGTGYPDASRPRSHANKRTPAKRQQGSRLSGEQIAKIVVDRTAGLSIAEICKRQQVARSTATKYLIRHGFDTGSPLKYTIALADEAAQLYVDDGVTLTQIGNRFGIGPDTVARALATKGITAKDRGRNRPRREALIRYEDRQPVRQAVG
jgi:transposase